MRAVVKKRILKEIREGAVKEYQKNGLVLIGGPRMVSFGNKVVRETFDSMSDDELWASLPKEMVAQVEAMPEDQLIGLDWTKIREWFKDFWEKYGDLIIAGIKILLMLLMFVMHQQKKKVGLKPAMILLALCYGGQLLLYA